MGSSLEVDSEDLEWGPEISILKKRLQEKAVHTFNPGTGQAEAD